MNSITNKYILAIIKDIGKEKFKTIECDSPAKTDSEEIKQIESTSASLLNDIILFFMHVFMFSIA